MAQMDTFYQNALYAVKELEAGLREPLAPEQQQQLLFHLSGHCRVAAICVLLTEADVPRFRHWLERSARARVQLLQLGAGRPPARFQCASHTGPLFDALTGDCAPLALEIARASPARWLGGEEWEEDFRYARFLHVLLLDGLRSTPEAESALLALQRAEEGCERPSPRRRLCEALLLRQQAPFDEALEDLLHEREQESLERERSGPLARPAHHHTEKYVFVEGLALLRLADSCGLKTRPEYPMLPGLARG
jgi:hypothetical protein